MEESDAQKIKKPEENHRVAKSTQTGFSSPATHYNEPRIDLNSVLISNSESTFFIRVIDDASEKYGISKNDVLIVDKSLSPKRNQMAIIIEDGEFQIQKFHKKLTEEIKIWGVITYIIKSVL
ncbi:S24 family peptidase [Frigoriflavimonas asaccharolytica]|uniref:DNA polymerase V n=1 Tax=Frigoriflavimonas asaccharolytica TaxID=2735899 RepID=A0A8J8K7H7_9FLAO|nr:S24 family peptidase [Frigoriflavimonas asaccharolytica]NRS92028.1 DNA polymerase V [Frigoriflavimonas asaccharolytica]